MFRWDHQRDFDAVLAASEPFALIRFGDGESALLDGRPHAAASAEWRVEGPNWISTPLAESLARAVDRFCIGLPPQCCLAEHTELHHRARAGPGHRTFATLFLHGNLMRTAELVKRFEPIIVGRLGEIAVPGDGVERGCDLDAIVAQMLQSERPMLVSAGPLANVLIDRYWQRQAADKRQIVLDVGSALDRYLTGRNSRYYHYGVQLTHHCTLSLPAGAITRTGSMQTITTQRSVSRKRNTAVAVGGQSGTKARGPSVVTRAGSVATTNARSTTETLTTSDSPAQQGPGKRNRCTKCVRVVRNRR